ncbi:MAG: hypothetical protein QNL39_14740 [Akkermansiaceae bacterium]
MERGDGLVDGFQLVKQKVVEVVAIGLGVKKGAGVFLGGFEDLLRDGDELEEPVKLCLADFSSGRIY